MQVHTNIVCFNLRKSAPLSAKDFILVLQQHDVHLIPFRCVLPSIWLGLSRMTPGMSVIHEHVTTVPSRWPEPACSVKHWFWHFACRTTSQAS